MDALQKSLHGGNRQAFKTTHDFYGSATSARQQAKRLPPHGKVVAARLSDRTVWPRMAGTSPDHQHVTVWICVGAGAWDTAHDWINNRLVMVCPPGEDPSSLDWRLCGGHDPVLIARCGAVTDAEVHALAEALIRDGAERVLDTATGRLWIGGAA